MRRLFGRHEQAATPSPSMMPGGTAAIAIVGGLLAGLAVGALVPRRRSVV